MATKLDLLEQHDWAVFDKTNEDCENEGNDGCFISGPHEPLPSSTPGKTTRLDSKEFDDWQEYNSTSKPQISSANPYKRTVNGIVPETDSVPINTILNGETERVPLHVTDPVRSVMEKCFPSSNSICNRQSISPEETREESLLTELQTTAISLSNFEWSRCLIKDQFLLAMIGFEQEMASKGNSLEELDLSGFDEFDWSLPPKPETVRLESVDSDSNDVRFSPQDEFQGLFRQPCNRLDSPIELEFDHGKAVIGLSMLSVVDLTMMRDEMAGKVAKLSNDLVSLLQTRDVLHLEASTKNRFIQAMLKVQESKHAVQQSTASGGPTGLEGSTTEGAKEKGLTVSKEFRRRSRSRSFQNLSRSLIAKAKSLRSAEEDKASNEMLLRVVIPYKQDAMGCWSVPLLKQWTKILLAMAEKNPNVSNLISDYLTAAIDSPVSESQATDENSQTKTEFDTRTESQTSTESDTNQASSDDDSSLV